MKTAQNAVGASLRAMIRDAKFIDKLIDKNPFDDLPPKWWPTAKRQKIDPFTEEEREKILKYYLHNRPYKEYAFVYFRFWTGTRPFGATALKCGELDLRKHTVDIVGSRYLNAEDNTKTRASDRTQDFVPETGVVAILEKILFRQG